MMFPLDDKWPLHRHETETDFIRIITRWKEGRTNYLIRTTTPWAARGGQMSPASLNNYQMAIAS